MATAKEMRDLQKKARKKHGAPAPHSSGIKRMVKGATNAVTGAKKTKEAHSAAIKAARKKAGVSTSASEHSRKINARADRMETRGEAARNKAITDKKIADNNKKVTAAAKKKSDSGSNPKPKAPRKPAGTGGKSGLKQWAAKERAGIAKQRTAKPSPTAKKAPAKKKKVGSHKAAKGHFYQG